ncbi:CLUMA_CG009903, isoform A [Clunio marinus]|uniref:Protein arginine N-methyltransferase n=1 Tax=Clunio marinus TaxID=568069 RepID=A0A1J1IAF7_9DIPT|nr:CLUMA_CG009903, isoform A [Clunio marinus]
MDYYKPTSKDDSYDYYQEVARSAFADMLHDKERNEKYSLGIKAAIVEMKSQGRKANVLDIGTGTGLLAMLAAQHGADTVTTIEAFSPVSNFARQIISDNGFKDKIKIITKHSTKVKIGCGQDMEQKANILVAEVLDTELIGEGAISTYNHAHKYLMESSCICVPHSASIFVQIVDCPTVVNWNSLTLEGIKIPDDVLRCRGSPSIHDLQLSQLPTNSFKTLGSFFNICDVDFSGKTQIKSLERFTKQFQVERKGVANAIFFWWEIKMNSSGSILLNCAPYWNHPDCDLKNSEKNEIYLRNSIPWRDHWMQGVFYIQSRQSLKENSCAYVTACHDEFSWWFEVSQTASFDSSIERPLCTCIFHMANSRSRIMEMNKLKIESFDLPKTGCLLFLGDHSLLGLQATLQTDAKIYIFQSHPLCIKSMKNFIESNNLQERVQLIFDLNNISEPITQIIADPHFNDAILPWDNIRILQKFMINLKNHKGTFMLNPVSASIYAAPVHFLNLHKIRWPLESSCEGFDHKMFDEVLDVASSFADANVEPFSLWEYPCLSLGSSVEVFKMNFNDESCKSSKTILPVESSLKTCNGIVFWVEWKFNNQMKISQEPSQEMRLNELINWSINDRHGVHLIPESQVKRIIKEIEIETVIDDEILINFLYFFNSK